ncbi:MAG TPA: DUF4386 family protein [Symbiobacteriaceae bacterium]|nr:DUF4386 family protein [Symbiobacteriaceae bacterium]
MELARVDTASSEYRGLYKLGGCVALLIPLVALVDIITAMLQGEAAAAPGTLAATNWFALLQDNWFLGMSNLGLLNIIYNTLSIPLFFALYFALRRVSQAYSLLATVLLVMGAVIYIATNTAFPMLALSGQYAAATTEAQRSLIAAAGQAVLAREDLTPGTFAGFFFVEAAGIMMALVMLRSKIFSKLTACTGLFAYATLLLFNIWVAFVPSLYPVAVAVGAAGGLVASAYYIIVAHGLFKLA